MEARPRPARPDVLSGVIIAAQGLIPWLVFRPRRDLSTDLRDMKSLLNFLVFGAIVNTAVTVIAATSWSSLTRRAWFSSGVKCSSVDRRLRRGAAAGDADPRVRRSAPEPRQAETPRTITNALQIVTVIILLGFAASFAIRPYLMNRLEQDRLAQQQHWLAAQEQLSGSISVLTRTILDERAPEAANRLQAASRIMIVTTLIDGMVFLILVFATVTLLYTVSRPFA